jgi:hypothetical protein
MILNGLEEKKLFPWILPDLESFFHRKESVCLFSGSCFSQYVKQQTRNKRHDHAISSLLSHNSSKGKAIIKGKEKRQFQSFFHYFYRVSVMQL